MFTQEQVQELYNKLSVLSKKDTSLPQADTVNWEDIFTIVQDGQNKKVNFRTFSESQVYQEAIASLVAQIEEKKQELAELMQHTEDILADISEATGVSQHFGQSQSVGISQKTLTNSITNIWEKIEEITHETIMGITMEFNPDYFISEGSVDVEISVAPIYPVGLLEKVELYKDGEEVPFYINEDVDSITTILNTDHTTTIVCKAVVLGAEFVVTKTITHYNEFWIGGGNAAADIMDVEHAQSIEGGTIQGSYNVTVPEDGHIIIVFAQELAEEFVRADMNGVEIPMTESSYTVSDVTYTVFTSNDTFVAGTYNIDINS